MERRAIRDMSTARRTRGLILINTGNATAASIWTVGIIGAAVGYGYFDIGLILALANLAVLKFRVPGGRCSI